MEEITAKKTAKMLTELADLMEIKGDNPFKIRAYRNAARALDDLSEELEVLVKENRLTDIKGIGKGIAGTIKEIFASGTPSQLEELKRELPAGLLELIEIPGLGPKRAHQLYYELEISKIDDLKRALANSQVQKLAGFGPKLAKNLEEAIARYEVYQEKMKINEADKLAAKILAYIKERPSLFAEISIAGSLRRRKELIRDIDILIAGKDKQEELTAYLKNFPEVYQVESEGKSKISLILKNGVQIDFRIVTKEEFPAALQYFTGSTEHNVKMRQLAKEQNYTLNEYGLFATENNDQVSNSDESNLSKEADIYETLGLDYIEPELREDRGEIELAQKSELPVLITEDKIKGDFHLHSRYSDGAHSIAEMAQAAIDKGYQYLAITDHSKSLRIASGLDEKELKKQREEIAALQEEVPEIKILSGIEVDILPDGSLDFSDAILAELDLVIASIHSAFTQDKETITERLVKACHNENVDILGHPRGRLLGRRDAYQVDMERVITAASETNTCLEINASPSRLDLDDLLARKAAANDVILAISTDAHHTAELEDMKLGVDVARRAWLEENQVLNTMTLEELKNFLAL